jgi:hypothetical protein
MRTGRDYFICPSTCLCADRVEALRTTVDRPRNNSVRKLTTEANLLPRINVMRFFLAFVPWCTQTGPTSLRSNLF